MELGDSDMPEFNPHFRDTAEVFDNAIAGGKLSADPRSPVYAGKYMYMFSEQGVNGFGTIDSFKHSITRKYIRVAVH